jgi:hydroxymethylbilane synthase
MTVRRILFGSRPSKLALWQTGHIMSSLHAAWPRVECQVKQIQTQGDRALERPLPEIGGKGLFTTEIEAALRAGQIDLAVHSLKDLPVEMTPGLCIGAIYRRGDAHDVLVSAGRQYLNSLPPGARIGTSSLRRQAQILAARPDLQVVPIRGNIDTRVSKALQGEYDAIVLAAAGVERLGLEGMVSEILPFEVMLPAPGQGALAIQCRTDDLTALELLSKIHDERTAQSVNAERAFLAGLGGGCSAPIAAYAREEGGKLSIDGLVAATDGRRVIRVTASGNDPILLGQALARQALELGAAELLV